MKFQGGSFDSWGGAGFDKCATMTNAEFERVFYKNSYSFGLKGINYYMVSYSTTFQIPSLIFEDIWRHKLGQPRFPIRLHIL